MVGDVILIEGRVGGFDGQLAALRHGVAGVERQVEERGLQLAGVGPDDPQVRGHRQLQLDRFAQGPAQQGRHLFDQCAGLEGLRRERVLAREGEQAVGQLGAAQGGPKDRVDMRFVLADLFGEKLHVANDDAQQIVEVVRHAAGQLADRLHPLGLDKPLLGPLAFGDVVANQEQAGLASGLDVFSRNQEIELLAALGPEFRLETPDRAVLRDLLDETDSLAWVDPDFEVEGRMVTGLKNSASCGAGGAWIVLLAKEYVSIVCFQCDLNIS